MADVNGASGIVSTGSQVRGCRANYNGEHGIHIDSPGYPGSVVSGSIAWGNQDAGIQVDSRGAIVRDNTAIENAGGGIEVLHGVVAGNAADRNGATGFFIGKGSTAIGNTASENGDVGLYTDGSTLVSQSSFSGNTTFGLQIDLPANQNTGYGETIADNNNGGNANPQVDVITFGGAAIELGTNACGGDTTCP